MITMAKSALPLPAANGGAKKVLGLVVLLVLVALAIKYPTDAATWVKSVAGAVGDVLDGLVTFVRNLGN